MVEYRGRLEVLVAARLVLPVACSTPARDCSRNSDFKQKDAESRLRHATVIFYQLDSCSKLVLAIVRHRHDDDNNNDEDYTT